MPAKALRAQGAVVGGPYDGVQVKPGGRRGLFAWINGEGRRYDKPGEGRHLHRAEMWKYRQGKRPAWIYAEGVWRECDACGAFYRLAEGGSEDAGCQLCGN